MKSLLKVALALTSIALSNSAFAADSTVTLSPELANGANVQVQTYAQVCLVNSTPRAVLVGTSWVGEARTMSIIPSGEEHIYRFEKAGPTVMFVAANVVAPVPSLDVAFRERGIFTTWHQSSAWTYFTYSKTDDCASMPKYDIRYVAADDEVDLQLVRVVTPVHTGVSN